MNFMSQKYRISAPQHITFNMHTVIKPQTASCYTVTSLYAKDFTYNLPPERIAVRPAEQRDQSRLLAACSTSRSISHHSFSDLPALLPAQSMIITNVTKVITARLEARKPTGGAVEILLLEPDNKHSAEDNLAQYALSRWKCMLGGRNLTADMILAGDANGCSFTAKICEKFSQEAIIEFCWQPSDITFGELIERAGNMPLPPYIKRRADASDAVRYQTVYARSPGSAAAPTAGLHFTPEILAQTEARGIARAELILAVGLGTFKPIETELIGDIVMHSEKIGISLAELQRITAHFNNNLPVICVGTTSLRAMESLYWFGVGILENRVDTEGTEFCVEQWTPYERRDNYPSASEALNTVINWAISNNLSELRGSTSLLIAPGYRFGTADGLITNFHQPGSTLLLLVAAFLGCNFWREVYGEALKDKDYRFLSYGDACLFRRFADK